MAIYSHKNVLQATNITCVDNLCEGLAIHGEIFAVHFNQGYRRVETYVEALRQSIHNKLTSIFKGIVEGAMNHFSFFLLEDIA